MLPRERVLGPVSQLFGRVAGGASATLRRVRETSFQKASKAPRHGTPRTGRGRPSGLPVALRRRTAGGDGASRSRSAGVGRGGGAKTGVSARWFLRAWSGPQAVSSVRRAQWPAGPSQEAGYDCRSVGGGAELGAPRCWTRGGSPRSQAQAESPRLASLPRSEPSARLPYIRSGKSWTNPREDFSKEGRGEKPETSSGSDPDFQALGGQGLAVGPCPGRPLSLGYPLARVTLRFLVLPPSRGGGEEASETPGERGGRRSNRPRPETVDRLGHRFPA